MNQASQENLIKYMKAEKSNASLYLFKAQMRAKFFIINTQYNRKNGQMLRRIKEAGEKYRMYRKRVHCYKIALSLPQDTITFGELENLTNY